MTFLPKAAYIFALLFPLLAAAWGPACNASAADYPRAVPFSCTTLAGEKISHAELFGGRPFVVLVFFGVNCKPCQKKIAQLNEVWRNELFRERASIFAVNADGFPPEKLADEMSRRKIAVDFPVIPDENQAITNLYVDGIVPLTVVIDRQDRILLSVLGARIESIRKIEELVLSGKEPGNP